MKTNLNSSVDRLYVRAIALLLCFAVGFSSCSKKDEEVTPETPTTPVDNGGLSTSTVASKLDTPWQIVFTPDGRMLFTERRGLVKVVENGTLKTEPYLNLRDSIIEAGESGLTGIAVDPDFAQNHYLYLAYSYEKSKNPFVIQNKIVRYIEDPTTKVPAFDTVLIDGIEGYINHNVGSMHFGPDGKLYIPVGERFIPEYAQDINKLNGKILRV